jgi:hypothetical protein
MLLIYTVKSGISQRHILYDVIYYTEFNFFRITVKIRANRRLSRIMVWFIDTFENMIEIKEINGSWISNYLCKSVPMITNFVNSNLDQGEVNKIMW